MPKRKKSRKVGQIGVPKSSVPRPPKEPGRKKAPKGKPAGSRHSQPQALQNNSTSQAKDPRLGSKKPISLIAEPKAQKPADKKPKYFSPMAELKAIEGDEKLASLLDKADEGTSLSREEQQYLDKHLARHQQLCEMLGIVEEDDEQAQESPDILDKFENSNLEDYK